MLRENWEFEYTGLQLSEAASRKATFHRGRLAWWLDKRKSIMGQIRSEGLEINEKLVMGYRNPKARDWEEGAQVMIRNDLQLLLTECQKKLTWHTERLVDFEGWHQILDANPHARKCLDIQDWLYFFSNDSSTEQADKEGEDHA
jgi:hypothetical protein